MARRMGMVGALLALLCATIARSAWQDDLRTIASFGDRLAGGPGEARTLAWAADKLRSLGYRVSQKEFEVTTPDPESRGMLRVGGATYELDPLWPNLVCPSVVKLSHALLIDGDQDQKLPLQGSVALLPFGSGDRWKQLAAHGVAAFIFWDDGKVTRTEGERKFIGSPINIPRFYFRGNAAALRRHLGSVASLDCEQKWIRRRSSIVEGAVSGKNRSEVLLGASADGISIVPSLAPGAESALGLVCLLDTAQRLARERPLWSVRVVVLGANALGLRGAREYVSQWGDRPAVRGGLTFDLSSGSDQLGLFARGWYYETRDETKDIAAPLARFLREGAPNRIEDTLSGSSGTPWKAAIPGRFALACEPFVLAQVPVLTLGTVQDARPRLDTPADRLEFVDLAAVGRQIETAHAVGLRLANDPTPRPLYRPRALSLAGGFGTVAGKVVEYNPSKGLVPNTAVPNSLAVSLGRNPTMMGVRGDEVQETGATGSFKFVGIPLVTAYLEQDRTPVQLAAFRIDAKGDMDRAPGRGVMGSDDYPITFFLKTTERAAPLVVFPSEATAYLGVHDPRDARNLRFEVLDSQTLGTPTRYGIFQRFDPKGEPSEDAVVFALPGRSLDVLARNRFGELAFLDVARKPTARVVRADLVAAQALWKSTAQRVDRFEPLRLSPKSLTDLQARAQSARALSVAAIESHEMLRSEQEGIRSWGWALRAYPIGRKVATDLLSGVLLYLFLLIPFSVFLERLLVHASTLNRQAAWSMAIFLASYVLLGALHPAFLLIPNPWIVFVAFVMAGLSAFVAGYLMARFDRDLKGNAPVRVANLERLGVLATSLTLGLTGMRRRRLRASLTALTLTVLTVVTLAFASIVPEQKVRAIASGRPSQYSGVLARLPDLGALPESLPGRLATEFAANSLRRVTLEPGDGVEVGAYEVSGPSGSSRLRALLGVDAGDPLLLAELEGRWPMRGESHGIVLPRPVAQTLGAVVGSKVRLLGVQRRVVGIYDPEQMGALRDLDGDGLMPPDFSLSRRVREIAGGGTSAFLNIERLDAAACAVLPADEVAALGGSLRSVVFAGTHDVRSAMERLRLNLYEGRVGTEVLQFSALPSTAGSGFGEIGILMVIAALFVLNAMIASVYERRREMATLSALGMAPHHLAAMFLAEATVLAVLASVSGYVIAQTLALLIRINGWLPGLRVDFSSASATISVLLVFGVAIVGALYPAFLASRSGSRVPPLDSDFVIEEDVAIARLPFWIPDMHSERFFEFLGEFFVSHQNHGAGAFLCESVKVAPDGVDALVHLVPFDANLSQKVAVRRDASEKGRVVVTLSRESGERAMWLRFNQGFLRALRAQAIAWRS